MPKPLLLFVLALATGAPLHAQSWIRVNQLGYLPLSKKVAVMVSRDPSQPLRSFEVRDALTDEVVWSSTRPVTTGPYAAFRSSSRLDFSVLARAGAYYVQAGSARSPSFRIAGDVYDGSADFLLRYMRQQRSGFNPFLKDSCHTNDGYVIYHPSLDSTFLDVSGGWHDASDYLQYVTTSANAVVQMLFAYERNPGSFSDHHGCDGLPGPNGVPDVLDEARWGLDWLLKMNPAKGMLFNQIADDRDHRGFRLPTLDTVDYGRGRQRPVYFCTGKPQGIYAYKNRTTGIASTAGKYASAFAMGSRLLARFDRPYTERLKQKSLEAMQVARESPGVCQTAPCRSPYFYEEENWVDDVELAATQLQPLFPDSGFLAEGARYGAQEQVTPWMGADSAHHYQWYPFVNLGHYYLASKGSDRGRFLGFMKKGLEKIYNRGKSNPFIFGVPFIWCSNNLVAAALTQARLYRELSGDTTFAAMEASLRDWLFGCNPWGTSMIVGLPRSGVSPKDPHSSLSHVYGFAIDGGLVDGPVSASIFKSLKGVTLSREDPLKEFQSDLAVYHDDWGDYSTDEPTMDGTASLTYSLSALQGDGVTGQARLNYEKDRGGIVRMDATRRELFLVFTGHEFGDGGEIIRRVLKKYHAKGNFFLTGDFYRNPEFSGLIRGLRKDGHYLGAHSDKHLLYAPWENRDSLLVSKDLFLRDLRENYRAMSSFGIRKRDAGYFLPPFEWYNQTVSSWAVEVGLALVNFTPGTLSNADYTYPGPGQRYVSSDSIFRRILAYEKQNPKGLKGFILLTHIGSDPRRPDKFYEKLDPLLGDLTRRGYRFKSF
jgi:peptidoglycan/xylan/chitin deacetylase (PgdA/CDA1 family)